jgi:probable poly-beta-1,6-N-acetyl-D-glucosamine export protein
MRIQQETLTNHDFYVNAVLRGVAIIAVVMVHTLANISPTTYTDLASRWWVVSLDQLGRFSVPLFVALSGYGFWQKYQHQKFSWASFLWKQSVKLLPWYVIASATFYITFRLIPVWLPPDMPKSFVVQLLNGESDYHLYFVPMIFQLYLIFPLVMWLMKKQPWLTLLGTAVFQILLYLKFTSPVRSEFFYEHLLTDHQQYFWFFSWIFYFVLGMVLPQIKQWLGGRKILVIGLAALTALSWWWTVQNGLNAMADGIDPIVALRFTRVPVLAYASAAVVTFFCLAEEASKRVQKMTSPLVKIGVWSYLIYLFHTLVLRIVFSGQE